MNQLTLYYSEKPHYIAVTQYGFAVHDLPAMAIWRAHDYVPDNARPVQLSLYETLSDIEPIGFKAGGPVWPNGLKPRLVGLTMTGQIYRQRPR